LLSEEYDPGTRRLVGHFPQAFTHVALINSALNLPRLEEAEERRAERVPQNASAA
jgi:GH15 family glucan-1,4-alpha-glucosidase